jgi:class 3 adenylate cyclase
VERAPATKYAKADDGVYLAYQVVGDGEVVFVGAPPIISNVEVIWEDPEANHFLATVGSFCRFIHYDKRGQGMSDRVADVPTLEQRAADLRAVMDVEGVERAVVGGISEGGTTAVLFAATHPERVSGLVVFGAFARLSEAPGYPGIPSAVVEETAAGWEAGWGTPATRSVELIAPERGGDARFLDWMNRYERQSSTPGGLRAQLRWLLELDVRTVLPVIRVPTLVMHRAGDRLIPKRLGRWLAESIPDARYVECPGTEHVPYLNNAVPLAELEEFVTGRRTVGSSDRVLATVLITDIVSSTERASALGDPEWRRVLDRHDALARHVVERYGGRVVKSTGDGLLATFDGPARGINAAGELVARAREIDLVVRAGLHTGEIVRRGDDVAGIAVHIAARVGALAEPGEVLVSRTVKDLVAGSGITFASRGEFDLKGIADRWELFRVVV